MSIFPKISVLLLSTQAWAQTSVVRFLPQGEEVTQRDSIDITFSKKMAPLGRMERKKEEIPVEISPTVDCSWIWISSETLSCKLNEGKELHQATHYKVSVKAEFKGIDGKAIGKVYDHAFTTERPNVSLQSFRRWLSPGFPVIDIDFNMPVVAGSLNQALSFVLDGGEKVHVRVLNRKWADENFYRNNESLASLMDDAFKQKQDPSAAEQSWLVFPEHELKGASHVKLQLEASALRTHLGLEVGRVARTLVEFDTFKELALEGIGCQLSHPKFFESDSSDSETEEDGAGSGRSRVKSRVTKGACDPLSHINAVFSSPVSVDEMTKSCSIARLPDQKKVEDFTKEAYSHDGLESPHYMNSQYIVQLPPLFKAQSKFTLSCTSGLTDMFGRKLGKDTQIPIELGSRQPRLDLGYSMGVLEKDIDSEIPVYVTNIKNTTIEFGALTVKGSKSHQSRPLDLQKVDNLAYATPLNVRGLLDGQSGAAFVTLHSPEMPSTHEPAGFFQVSPFEVHFKEGHFKSLVWVRDLKTGAAVKNAEVTLFSRKLSEIEKESPALLKGTTDSDGIAWLPGYTQYDPKLKSVRYGTQDDTLIVQIKKDKDLGLVPVHNDFSASPSYDSGVWSNRRPQHGHMKVWGTTAQGVYRAGESIDYKIYVREQDERKFVPAGKNSYTLIVRDPSGQEVHRQEKIKLNEFGSLYGSFSTPKSATVGWYEFHLSSPEIANDDSNESYDEGGEGEGESPKKRERTLHAMSVLVTDFTPAPFRTENDIDRTIYQIGETIKIASRAKLHSGGAYGDAKVRVNVGLTRSGFEPKDPLTSQYSYSCGDGQHSSSQIFEKELKLDSHGELKTDVIVNDKNIQCGRLVVTSDVADDRGKYFSAVKEAKYYSVNRFVGVRKDKYFFNEGENAEIEFVVADPNGKAVFGVPATLTLQRHERKVARVKGAGNAYLEEVTSTWVDVTKCEKKSDSKGVKCAFKVDKAGSYKVLASVSDTHGIKNQTEDSFYASGKTEIVWDDSNANALRIIPEKTSPKIGEKARYLVQNPYPGAEALITIERYGVLKAWTQKFTTSTPVVEFEVDDDYLPGFYLSVVVYSPRVAKPLGDGNVDLGKPAFRLGYVRVMPENASKEIDIKVMSKAEVYKPRDTVEVALETQSKSKRKLGSDVEYAVAVLDEAVFDLIQGGASYFDVYNGFYHLDNLDITNFNILMQLIGRQKFEKKGANTGGDGGGFSARSLFKYVAYWNPSIKADAKGKAQIKFQVPDNLTGWIVLAMAVDPADRMGLGKGHFKVNRATEVRPVMPNLVLEGDSFKGAFTVMNRTDKKRTLHVSVNLDGDLAATQKAGVVLDKDIEAEPFKRNVVDFDVHAGLLSESRLIEGGKLKFLIKAGDAFDTDALVHEIPVHKKRSFSTAASYGTTDDKPIKESIEFPGALYTDVGHVQVQASPSVIGNLEGAFDYMWRYPYLCWEQRLTKGTMASSYLKLKHHLDPALKWSDADAVVKRMIEDAPSFQAPNGGMTYFVANDVYVSPYLSAYTALAFEWLKARGVEAPGPTSKKLNAYLLNLLRSKAFPTFYTEGMSSTVRAVALAALSKSKAVTSQDVERYRGHVKDMDLFGKAHYLQAALEFPDKQAAAKETLSAILGKANESAGRFRFTEDLDYGWIRIHSSELRTQCAILSAISKAASQSWSKAMIGDVPFKLVRFITQSRGKKDHWENTQENIFCGEALVDYSRRYEADKPDLKVSALFDGKPFGTGALKDFRDKALVFNRNISSYDPGKKATVEIKKNGKGRIYTTTSIKYAPIEKFTELKNAGIEIRREYSVERNKKMELLQSPYKIKQGDVVRVDLYLNLPSARNYVVVDDAVPGGLEPLNTDLATTSNVDASKATPNWAQASFFWNFKDWNYFGGSFWSFYQREVRHDSVRFYSEYLEKGHYNLSYMTQAIARGSFAIPPVHAEEMYDPDVYGKGVEASLEVGAP